MLRRQTGEIGGVIKPRIHLSQAAILFRKTGPPLLLFRYLLLVTNESSVLTTRSSLAFGRDSVP